jgi:hypothetical protein
MTPTGGRNNQGYGGGFAGRRPGLNAQQLRAGWVSAIALAARCAKAAADAGEGEAPVGAAGDVARLMATLRDLKRDNFPVATWSARQMAAAFLTLSQSFVRPEMGPEARTACAPFLAAGAATLDALMTVDRTEAARASWMRQSGERD